MSTHKYNLTHFTSAFWATCTLESNAGTGADCQTCSTLQPDLNTSTQSLQHQVLRATNAPSSDKDAAPGQGPGAEITFMYARQRCPLCWSALLKSILWMSGMGRLNSLRLQLSAIYPIVHSACTCFAAYVGYVWLRPVPHASVAIRRLPSYLNVMKQGCFCMLF